MGSPSRRGAAFTLIELLVVVVIIAILAAIAVPNFLEAQTRARVSRAQADMRAIELAIQAYVVDHNKNPIPLNPWNWADMSFENIWWGFVSTQITTPVAYISSIPRMPFFDTGILKVWQMLGGTRTNQPYTYIAFTGQMAKYRVGKSYCNTPHTTPEWEYLKTVGFPREFKEQIKHSRFVLYTSGPDNLDTTVYRVPIFYDPSNGTVSRGDIYRFGAGIPARLPDAAMAMSPYNEANPED